LRSLIRFTQRDVAVQTFLGALRFVEGRSISTELMDDQRHPFTSSSVRWAVRLPVAATDTTDIGGSNHNGNDQPRSGKRRRVDPHEGTSSSSPIDGNSDNDINDETKGGAGGKLVFSYDRKLSVRNGAKVPNAWHERLAVRAVIPDHQQLEGFDAGEEYELNMSQYTDAGLREHESKAKLADIGHLLGLRPTASTTSGTAPSSHVQKEEEKMVTEEVARFGEKVANLLVMVAKVAMWDAHLTLPPPCAFNQELADHLDCIAAAEMDQHGAASDDQPPTAAAPEPSPQVRASVQFVEDYLREPWPGS
jgi:hypothetical protein